MDNLSWRQVRVVLLTWLGLLVALTDSKCTFPEEWRGGWYENYIGDVNISQHGISSKGECEQKQDTKYIVKQVRGDDYCFRCLVFTYRPDNILEYKESFCMNKKTALASICPRIMPNAMLKTLIRRPSKPIPCPFQGNYQFSYTNSSAMCSNPFSTVSNCASESQLEFHFKQCSNNRDSHKIDLELKCLAKWKSGGNFLMGKFTDMNSLKEMYRCFMYEIIGDGALIAMSADATCRGLIDPKDGPVTMAMQLNVIRYPVGRDQFPSWMWNVERKWHDLSGVFTYHIDKTNTEIRIYKRIERGEKVAEEALRCYTIDRITTTDRLFQAISMTSRDCVTKFQCVRILRRADDVVEFHRANWVSLQSEACNEDNFRMGVKHLLIPSKIPGARCPYDGRYDVVVSDKTGCRSTYISGCEDRSQLRVDVNCPSSFPGARLKCLSSWSYNATTYMIARRHHGGLLANCFSFTRQSDRSIRFSLDKACNMGAPLLIGEKVTYTLRSKSSSCQGLTSENSVSDNGGPGGQKQKSDVRSAASTTSPYHRQTLFQLLTVVSLATWRLIR